MIVQACINGARAFDYHPCLPTSIEEIARDSAACVAAGAAELHLHPRNEERRESLNAVSATVRAVRQACPGTLIGVSTGAWIEGSAERTISAIEAWSDLADYASVNLSEPDAPGIMELLHRRGVGIEAGLASVLDAERLVGLGKAQKLFRVLIEVEQQEAATARAVANDIAATLAEAGFQRPILLHGFDATVWPLVALAYERRWSTRVGLEDGDRLPDGRIAPDNAALIAAAVTAFSQGRGPVAQK